MCELIGQHNRAHANEYLSEIRPPVMRSHQMHYTYSKVLWSGLDEVGSNINHPETGKL